MQTRHHLTGKHHRLGELKEKNTVHIGVTGEGDDMDLLVDIESSGEDDQGMTAKL